MVDERRILRIYGWIIFRRGEGMVYIYRRGERMVDNKEKIMDGRY